MEYLRHIFLVSVLLILSACIPVSVSEKTAPVAVIDGKADLQDVDFTAIPSVDLSGEWLLKRNVFVSPADIDFASFFPDSLVTVPGAWHKGAGGESYSRYGYGTYYLKILLPLKRPSLALRLLDVGSAYSLFVNGVRVGGKGIAGSSAVSSRWQYASDVYLLPDDATAVDVVFHVSNFHDIKGGLIKPVSLARTAYASKQRSIRMFLDFFLFGGILIIGVYHLILYLLRKDEKINMFFGLFCLVMSFRSLFTGERVISYLFPNIPFHVFYRIDVLTIYVAYPLYGLYIQKLFPKDFPQWLGRLSSALLLVFPAIVLFTDGSVYQHTILPYELIMVLIGIMYVKITADAIRFKREGALTFVCGFIFIFVAVANDILFDIGVINSVMLSPYGLFAFFLIQAFLLSSRFSKAYLEIERISAELSLLNTSLETKVQQRTDELEKHSRQLEAELLLAKQIQQNLIPKKKPADNIGFFYKPMVQVGGDFYDFIQFRDNNSIGIFISDVSGHGVAAAFITSMVKTLLLQAGERKLDPSALFRYMNNALESQTNRNFVTAFYGIYNTGTKKLLYCNAGHNHPYLVNGGVSQLNGGKSTALSIFNNDILRSYNKEYQNCEIELEPGTKVLFYTDGLTEASSTRKTGLFEDHTLVESLVKNSALSSDQYISALYRDLVQFRGNEVFDDDICMICLDIE